MSHDSFKKSKQRVLVALNVLSTKICDLLMNLMLRRWFVFAGVFPGECDSLSVWPCGTPSLLKLEAAYEQATHHRLPVYVIMCVSKGVCVCRCYCWNIKVLPW